MTTSAEICLSDDPSSFGRCRTVSATGASATVASKHVVVAASWSVCRFVTQSLLFAAAARRSTGYKLRSGSELVNVTVADFNSTGVEHFTLPTDDVALVETTDVGDEDDASGTGTFKLVDVSVNVD